MLGHKTSFNKDNTIEIKEYLKNKISKQNNCNSNVFLRPLLSMFPQGCCCQCSPHLSEPQLTLHPQEVLQFLQVGLWSCSRHCRGSSHSDMAQPLHACAPKILLKLDQSQFWQHSSIQIFCRFRVFQAVHRDSIWGLCSQKFLFFFPSHTAPGAQLQFQPHICMWDTLRHLFPAQVRRGGGKS